MSRTAPNGCGPWWIPKSWKDTYFIEACTIHDEDYLEGVDRYEADIRFYRMMRAKIMTELNPQVRWWRTQQARFYYHIVRRLGWLSHKNGLDI